jgi:hypothetical protein
MHNRKCMTFELETYFRYCIFNTDRRNKSSRSSQESMTILVMEMQLNSTGEIAARSLLPPVSYNNQKVVPLLNSTPRCKYEWEGGGGFHKHVNLIFALIRVSSVGIATGYGLDGWGSILGESKNLFSSPQLSDWFWCPPSLPSNGYQRLFTWG